MNHLQLKQKIENKAANICIIGLGYVGLPLAIEFLKAGFTVYGVDNDKDKINKLRKGTSYVTDIEAASFHNFILHKNFIPTVSFNVLKGVDIICICVPTPLTRTKEPDISAIIEATNEIKKYLRIPQLIILESTSFPGTTEEVVLPKLQDTNLKVGRDFFLAFSPERIDPGNKEFTIKNTPKVVSGVTKKCTELAHLLYKKIVDNVIVASTPKTAEMAKLLENIFRSVNIALVNEMALLCDKINLDIFEVINLAKTKPFGFMPFYPGPGVGGHCLPIDPFYLSWKAKEYDFQSRFIELSGEVNAYMPYFVVYKTRRALNSVKKALKEANILIVGVAYKKDIADYRESPALKVIELLQNNEARITYYDPYIDNLPLNCKRINKLNKEIIKKFDCILIITDHSNIDYDLLVKNAQLIVDTRGVLRKFTSKKIIII